MTDVATCHPSNPVPFGYEAREGIKKKYPKLVVVTYEGDSYPDEHTAWCGVCGSLWTFPRHSKEGIWVEPTAREDLSAAHEALRDVEKDGDRLGGTWSAGRARGGLVESGVELVENRPVKRAT